MNLNLVIAGIVIIGLALECLSLSLRVRRMTAALVHWESVFAAQNAQIERLVDGHRCAAEIARAALGGEHG